MRAERRELFPGYRPSFGDKVFVENLIAIIERKRLSHKGLAEKLGVNPSYISRIMNRHVSPSLKLACRMIDVVGVEFEELVSSREIDSWLAEHLSVLEGIESKKIIEGLSVEQKWRLRSVIEELEEAGHSATE